jgi:predicted metalloprotease with PDZ domain
VAVLQEPAQMAQALGLRVLENSGIQVKMVLRGGAAERAGFAAGDEWLGIEPIAAGSKKASAPPAVQGWRLNKLEELMLYAGSHKKVLALVARDKRLLRLELALPAAVNTARLVLRDAALAGRWLAAAA